MSFTVKCNLSLLLLLITFAHCSENPNTSESYKKPIDSVTVINQILENDSQKKIDTANLVYKLGKNNGFIKAQMIRRGIGTIKGDTIQLEAIDSSYFIMVQPGTMIHLKLPNKANAWLNAGTIISFTKDITKNNSIIRLAGEGCFTVSKESKDSLIIKTQGNHKFVLNRGLLNINTFAGTGFVNSLNNLPATDQELNNLTSKGELKNINCNPCSLDSLIDNWNHKENRNVVADRSRIHDSAEPVYVNMTQARFPDIITNVMQKQSKLGGYFNRETFIITGTEYRIIPVRFSANLKSGYVKVYCGNCQQNTDLKGNECLVFEKYDLLTKKSCDPEVSMSWTKGYFEPSQHKQFLEKLERWYDIEVTLSNSSAINAMEGHIPFQASLQELLELFKLNQIHYKLMLTNTGEKLNLLFE